MNRISPPPRYVQRTPQVIPSWQPHVASTGLVPPLTATTTADTPPPAPPPPTRAEERFLEQIQSGFKSITATLIFTGVAIGFASAIGAALGAILINRFAKPSSPRRGR